MQVRVMSEQEDYTVADAFLESLALVSKTMCKVSAFTDGTINIQAGVDYIFGVLGSDHPSIIEAYVRRQKSPEHQWPKLLLFLHEVKIVEHNNSSCIITDPTQLPAISAADGYARYTGKPQCVLVHVDVGTNALGQGWHTASSGKAPILVFAGQAPYTLHGELPGSRSEHVQWYQDVPNQHAMVAPFSRYSNEIKTGEHVQMMVNRAVLMATTGSPGPTYLTATREALAAKAQPPGKVKIPSCSIGGLPNETVERIAKALIEAKKPLVVTGYLGQNHAAVEALVKLADELGNLRVFDSEQRVMSFPATHPAWLSRTTGAGKAIKEADLILVIDADVPWIPTKVKPSPEATIYHIDLDPRKEVMNLFDIYADDTFHANAEAALGAILDYVSQNRNAQGTGSDEHKSRKKAFEDGQDILSKRAQPSSDELLNKDFLFRSLAHLLPDDTVFVHDIVTNQVPMTEQLGLSRPGSNFSKGSSGLGWAIGAAVGISLASRRYAIEKRPKVDRRETEGPGKFVCMTIGDGSFMFGVPSAAFWAAYRHKTPFLTVILDNGGWKATRSCVNDVHPNGIAAGMTDEELAIDLKPDGPDYCGIAKAATNGNLKTWKVDKWRDLEPAIKKAVASVQNGTGAIIDAVIKD